MLHVLGFAAVFVGIVLLRQAWLRRGRARMLALGGWFAVGGGFYALMYAEGAEIGVTYGLLALSIGAYGTILANIQLSDRAAQVDKGDRALEPEQRRTNIPRAIAKSLLAIVLAGVAAIGIGVAFAVSMPLEPQDRIMIGGLLVPVLWGGGMAWTLSDAKLARAAILLTLVSIVSYAIAFLPKVFR